MSLKKIADAVGVSMSTVSRVLNNPDYRCSNEGLREKIWRTAMEYNYAPNQAARNLKLGVNQNERKTYYINVLMTRSDESRTDPFFTEVLHIIESEIHRNYCILSKVWYKPIFSDDKKCRYTDLDGIIAEMYQETEEKCDGLIVIGKCNKDALKKISQTYKCVVAVNRNSTSYEVDEVLCDGEKVAATAVEYLLELGHTKIGYVGECQNEARYRGYIDTLRNHGIDVNPNYIVKTKRTEVEGYEAMEALLQKEDYPTAIYCVNDITAIGMLKALNTYKNLYIVPSIIASDDIEEAQYSKPMLTTVHLPKKEMGKLALSLLVDRMKNGHTGIVRAELEGKLMIRNSCRRIDDNNWAEYVI